jgi:hypothetical protein
MRGGWRFGNEAGLIGFPARAVAVTATVAAQDSRHDIGAEVVRQ